MNLYKKAFLEPVNLICLAAVAARSFALWQPHVAVIGGVVEAAYLLLLPNTKWYKNRILGNANTDDVLGLSARASQLPADLNMRFKRLAKLRTDIDTKLKAQVSFQTEVIGKLDQLITQFVDLAETHAQFISYLQSLVAAASQQSAHQINRGATINYPAGGVYSQLAYQGYGRAQRTQTSVDFNQLTQQATAKTEKWVQWAVGRAQSEYSAELSRLDPDSETDPSLKEIKLKRMDIIARRSEYLGKLSKAILNSLMQLQLIEDTVGLIDDQVSTQSPDQVVGEIDSLVQQTDILTKSLAEVGQMYVTHSA